MKKIRNIIIVLTLVALSIPFAVIAQGQTATETQDIKCYNEIGPFLEQSSKEFREYITSHFQNKSTNTSLLDLALKRFQQYRKDVFDEYHKYFPQEGLDISGEAIDTLKCYNRVITEINLNQKLMQDFFVKSSNAKTSSAQMNKLKAINEKLKKLNGEVTNMHGKWQTLSGKIPCYISQCLSK